MAIELLRRYFRERFVRLPIAALVLLLIGASLLVSMPATGGEWASRAALVCLLVFQFRLWDDLEDLGRDRIEHPHRVLVNAQSLAPFHIAAVVAAACVVWLLGMTRSRNDVIEYVVLCLGMKLWYHWLRASSGGPVMHAAIVLLKYPAFVWFLVPAADRTANWGRLAVIEIVLYGILVFYEWLHDLRRNQRGSETQP